MKPLDDEQRKKIWDEISDAIVYSTKPRAGELTKKEIQKRTGLSQGQLRPRIEKLLEEEILGVRKIAVDGSIYNVYFPLADVSDIDILELLAE